MDCAILGGTFDPVHYGHLRVAEEVKECLRLERVIFIPAARPPHKEERSFTAAEHRLHMVRLAIEGNPAFEASEREIQRGGASYSVDTLREIAGEEPDSELHFIVGADSFNEITTWHEYEELFKLANIIVVPRPGYALRKLENALPVAVASHFWYDEARDIYSGDGDRFIRFVETTAMGISASEIRGRVKRGASIRYLLPAPVAEYIEKEGLYR